VAGFNKSVTMFFRRAARFTVNVERSAIGVVDHHVLGLVT